MSGNTILQGRGLWLGAQESADMTMGQWDLLCQQCRRWGISTIHPKVGDGIAPNILWFDQTFLQNLRHIAVDYYHIVCIPYIYCYGNMHGKLQQEAQALAYAGSLFGGVSPDIESEWDNQTQWAIQMGQYVRQTYGYTGPVYPTVFANPVDHPTPIVQLNAWVDGFMPQVYFSVWTPPTAQNALNFAMPQWALVNAHLKTQQSSLKPLLPIISLDNGVQAQEVANWLHLMQHYGYCGFWYLNQQSNGTSLYGQYANTILNAPEPSLSISLTSVPLPAPSPSSPTSASIHLPPPSSSSSSSPTKAPIVTTTSTPTVTVPAPEPAATPVATIPIYNQNLTNSELEVIWHLYDPHTIIPFDPTLAICATWIRIIQMHPDWFFGSPLHTEQQVVTSSGVQYTFQTFSGGEGTCQIWWFPQTGKTAIVRGENDPLLIRQAIQATINPPSSSLSSSSSSSPLSGETQIIPAITIPATV